MKAPKRSIADHLAFTTWIIFAIIITIMMIQIPRAQASDFETFYQEQKSLAEDYLREETYVVGAFYGVALGAQEMHNMMHQVAKTGEECVLIEEEILNLLDKSVRNFIARKYTADASLKTVVVMSIDVACGQQTGESMTKALADRASNPRKRS